LYDVKVNYIGYKEGQTTGVLVQPGQDTRVNTKLQPSTMMDEVVVVEYTIPLIDPYQGGGSTVKTAKELEAMPVRTTSGMVSTNAGVYSQKDDGVINIAGGRGDGTLYIIDGVQVYGTRGI